MRKKVCLIVIFLLVFSSFFATVGRAEENYPISVKIKQGEKIVFSQTFYLNPEFKQTAKGNENKTVNFLRQGFADNQLCNYLFYDLGSTVESFFDSIDSVSPCDCINFYPKREVKFTYHPERSGHKVNREDFYDKVFSSFSSGEIVWEVAYQKSENLYTLNQLEDSTKLLASFSTYYGNSKEGRKHNVRLASSFLSGKVIRKGQILSFNDIVGARTAERGFKEAKVISEGNYVDGVGGGVCQVATTLYNASLRAGLTPTLCTRHTLAPSYVPLSFDAMVSSWSDLKIKNTTGGAIYLALFADGENLTVKIYGKKEEGLTYKFVSETVDVIKHEEFSEERASEFRDGYKSRGYKLVYENGNLKEKILIREDFYKPYKINSIG